MSENTKNEWSNKELGVLWKRKAKTSGENYLTGTINLKSQGLDKDIPVIIFSNKTKKQDNHPDLRIYISEKRDGAKTTTAAPVKKATPAPKPAEDNELI